MGEEGDRIFVDIACDAEVLEVCAGKRGCFFPPVVWSDVEIFGPDEIADSAAFVSFGDAGPEAVELLTELVGFVEQDRCAGDEIKDGVVSAGDGSVELPAGEDVEAASADGGFDYFFGTFDSFAAEAGVNCAEKMFADWSLGERKKQGFIHRIRGTLGGGVEFADGIGFVAEEFDAQGTVGFGRVDIENAAANGVLAGHLDDVG